MCKYGDTVLCKVLIKGNLSYTGKDRWAEKPIDRCIAPIVQALNDAGLFTSACCCGHGAMSGLITLYDGRAILLPVENQMATPEWPVLQMIIDNRRVIDDRTQSVSIDLQNAIRGVYKI